MSSFISSHDNSFLHFLDNLGLHLNVGTDLRVYHISTLPISTTPIFASVPGRPDESTTCESHFLTISQPHVITSTGVDLTQSTNGHDPARTAGHVLLLGIEVLVFSTDSLTTVFVSKADSTGFLSRPTPAEPTQESSSIVKLVISAFLEWLIDRQLSSTELESDPTDVTNHDLVIRAEDHENGEVLHQSKSGQSGSLTRPKRLVLSLFARSQNQYLFPGSIENTTKHVLDDRQLIKWWCRVLDSLVQKNWSASKVGNGGPQAHSGSLDLCSANVKVPTNAYVVVPGCDRTETIRSFFPPSARSPSSENIARWHNSYPVNLLIQHDQILAEPSLPVRCLIPRLPDDPKARYCNDLDDAGIDDKGRWKDVRSLQQFWEMMEYRQECAAGRLVGFVWVVFDPVPEADQTLATPQTEIGVTNTTTTNRSETVTADSLVRTQQTSDPTRSSRGSVILTNEQYITLSDLLINTTDFAGAELAVKSTGQWIDKVKELSGLQNFGVDVDGKKTKQPTVSGPVSKDTSSTVAAGSKHSRDEGITPVNVLTGVRKKKQKVSSEPPRTADNTTTETDGCGIIASESKSQIGERNEKIEDTTRVTNGNGVMTLSAGLVRKKPKAME